MTHSEASNALNKARPTAQLVEAHALDTFGSAKKAEHWLSRPNRVFQGETPRQIIKVDPSAVEAALIRIVHGVYL